MVTLSIALLKRVSLQQCCAIDYITHTLDSATALLNSPRAFPSRYVAIFTEFPKRPHEAPQTADSPNINQAVSISRPTSFTNLCSRLLSPSRGLRAERGWSFVPLRLIAPIFDMLGISRLNPPYTAVSSPSPRSSISSQRTFWFYLVHRRHHKPNPFNPHHLNPNLPSLSNSNRRCSRCLPWKYRLLPHPYRCNEWSPCRHQLIRRNPSMNDRALSR